MRRQTVLALAAASVLAAACDAAPPVSPRRIATDQLHPIYVAEDSAPSRDPRSSRLVPYHKLGDVRLERLPGGAAAAPDGAP